MYRGRIMPSSEKRKSALPRHNSGGRQALQTLRAEIGRLRLEVARLKRQLPGSSGNKAETHPHRPATLAPAAAQALKELSPRLRETFELLLTGETERAISAKMSISVHTCHEYVKTLYARLGVSSRSKLFAWSVQPHKKASKGRRDSPIRPRQPTAKAIHLQEQSRALPAGISYQEIARRLGVNYPVARMWARRLGYKSKLLPRGRPSAQNPLLKQIQNLPENLTIAQVAGRLKVSSSAAYYLIHKTGYRFRRAGGSF